jgi:hypothetical protein
MIRGPIYLVEKLAKLKELSVIKTFDVSFGAMAGV